MTQSKRPQPAKIKDKPQSHPNISRQGEGEPEPADTQEFHLSRRDAAAAAPADESVTGEEDPGAGLEFLVKK